MQILLIAFGGDQDFIFLYGDTFLKSISGYSSKGF